MAGSVTKLDLVIPGLLGPMPGLAGGNAAVSFPVLERLLSRADQRTAVGKDLSSTLIDRFNYTVDTGEDLPEAAINLLGEGLDPEDACWMRADPVHLRADRDSLLLFDSEQLGIASAEAETIAGQFNEHFTEDKFRLLTPASDRWYLKLEQCPEMQTHSLSEVVGRHIEPFMPSGPDAGRWRQLNNEMQMLLFQSAVNSQRESEGRLTLNGLWLSGIGRLPQKAPASFSRVFAENPTACGLAGLCGVTSSPIPDDLGDVWQTGNESLLVLPQLISPVLNADHSRWIEVMQKLELDLYSLLESMKKLDHPELRLYPCNKACYRLTPGALRRFWRRRKSIWSLLG